jgi:hypothetical protein
MTDNGDDFWDLLYRGCGIPGNPPPAAKEGCPPPDREAEQQRVFRIYEQALRRNSSAKTAADADRGKRGEEMAAE